MNRDKLQIWLCFGIIIVCIVAYILIGCIPWSELTKKTNKDNITEEPFICPWDVINELTTNKLTNKVFIKDERDTNKQMLDIFAMKTYKCNIEELAIDMYNTIINDIVNTIKKSKINSPDMFIKVFAS